LRTANCEARGYLILNLKLVACEASNKKNDWAMGHFGHWVATQPPLAKKLKNDKNLVATQGIKYKNDN